MSLAYPKISPIDLNSKRTWTNGNKNWYIQEKIDGSQLSFSVSEDHATITFYNKNGAVSNNSNVFRKAVCMLSERKHVFSPMYRYHGEAVCSNRHNVVCYKRVPKYYFILYDLQDVDTKKYLSVHDMEAESKRVDLESVICLYQNEDESISPYNFCQELISKIEKGEIQSNLGGQMEGVVLKHNSYIDSRGSVVSTKLKYVTPIFQERHAEKQPPREKLSDMEFLSFLGSQFSTTARFHKAVQHLKERDVLVGNFEIDLPLLIEELDKDLTDEYREFITNYLWVEFSPVIISYARAGLSQWYKLYLKKTDKNPPSKKKEKLSKGISDFIKKIVDDIQPEKLYLIAVENLSKKLKGNEQKDLQIIFPEIERIIYEMFKDKIKKDLWDEYGQVVLKCARTGFSEWYENEMKINKNLNKD